MQLFCLGVNFFCVTMHMYCTCSVQVLRFSYTQRFDSTRYTALTQKRRRTPGPAVAQGSAATGVPGVLAEYAACCYQMKVTVEPCLGPFFTEQSHVRL